MSDATKGDPVGSGQIHALLWSFFILFSVLFVFLTVQRLYSCSDMRFDLTCCTSLVVSSHEESEGNTMSSRSFICHGSGADSVCKLSEVNRFTSHRVLDTSGRKLDGNGGKGHQNDATAVRDGHWKDLPTCSERDCGIEAGNSGSPVRADERSRCGHAFGGESKRLLRCHAGAAVPRVAVEVSWRQLTENYEPKMWTRFAGQLMSIFSQASREPPWPKACSALVLSTNRRTRPANLVSSATNPVRTAAASHWVMGCHRPPTSVASEMLVERA